MASPSDYGIRLPSDAPGDYKVLCPKCSHRRKKKKEPCLSVTVSADGSFLWNCHNGDCDFRGKEEPEAIRANGAHGPRWMAGFGEPSAEFKYEDDLIVCRYETSHGKEIRPWHLIGGKWKPGKPKGYNKLFRHLDLSWHATKPVIVVEGEKKCLKAINLFPDFYVVSPIGGAKNFKNADWSGLAGRDVYLFPDNDEPGFAAMQDVHARVGKIAKSVTWIKPEEDRAKGWDIGDWSDDDAKQWGSALAWMRSRIKKAAATPRVGIHLIPFSEISLQDTQTYIVKNIIPSQGMVVFWGPPKCGKSFFVSDLALHVALGWDWRGLKVKSGPVVYVAAEGARGFKARIEAFRQERLAEHHSDVPFYLVPSTIDLINAHGDLINAIKDQIGSVSPTMLVLDTLNRTLNGSENSDEDMSAYIKAIDAIRETFACTVLVVHHCGIEGTRPRGHTSLTGALDAQIAVKKTDGAIKAQVEFMKDGDEGQIFFSTLRVVEVGADENGEPITSCVIEEAEDPGRTTDEGYRLNDTESLVMEVLLKAFRNSMMDGTLIPLTGGQQGVKIEAVRPLVLSRMGDIGDNDKGTQKKKWQRAWQKLQRIGLLDVNDNFIWPTKKARGHEGDT